MGCGGWELGLKEARAAQEFAPWLSAFQGPSSSALNRHPALRAAAVRVALEALAAAEGTAAGSQPPLPAPGRRTLTPGGRCAGKRGTLSSPRPGRCRGGRALRSALPQRRRGGRAPAGGEYRPQSRRPPGDGKSAAEEAARGPGDPETRQSPVRPRPTPRPWIQPPGRGRRANSGARSAFCFPLGTGQRRSPTDRPGERESSPGASGRGGGGRKSLRAGAGAARGVGSEELGVCGARGAGRRRAGAPAGAGAQRRPCRVAGVAARGARTRAPSAARRPNFCLRPRGRRRRGRAVRPRVTSSHVNGFLLCCRRGGGTGDRRERVCAQGSASAFPPAGAEHELPAPFERKRKEEKLGSNSRASGRWARGRGAAESGGGGGGGSGTAATPASPPRPPLRTDHAALAGSGGRTGANKVRPSWRGGAGPRGDGHRARCVGGGESERGAAWAGRRANTGRGGRPEPSPCRRRARSCEPGAGGSRGSPAAPKCARTRRKGAGPGRARGGAARRGPHLAELAGQRRRRLHNNDFNPPEATRLPRPRGRRGSAPRGESHQVAPEVARVRSAPAELRGSERERPRWLEAKRSAGRGRRAAGDALFVWFAPGLGSSGCGGAGTLWAAVRGGCVRAGRARAPGRGAGGSQAGGVGGGVSGGSGEGAAGPEQPSLPSRLSPDGSASRSPAPWERTPNSRPAARFVSAPVERAARGVLLQWVGRFSRRSLLETVHASILN
nr:spidroin-1-like [Equus asinus]